MSQEGKERIKRLVEIFQIPHVYYKEPLARELAGVFLRKTGNFCAPCELLSFNLHSVIAREYNIPLIVVGSSARTDGAPPKNLNPWDPWYFSNVIRGENYDERLKCSYFSRNYIIREGIDKILGRRRIIALPDYVEWDEDRISQVFKDRYGIIFGKEHSDCIATDISEYIYRIKCGNCGPKTVKYSLLIRSDKIMRKEALDKLSESETNEEPSGLEDFLGLIGMTREDFEIAIRQSPEQYVNGISKMFNSFRRRVRSQAS
jgi:hypothetical protein